ncbi:MAG: tripartite tricarboxylate transporter substrate binding protein [Burkholderiales bacterium]
MTGLCIAQPVAAQSYPVKPVRIVVPYPPGGVTDILTRIIGQKLTETWRQQVIIDNRAGGSGNIGAEAVVRAPADGYTLLSASTVHTVNPSLYARLSYDPLKDFTSISLLAQVANVLVVHPSLPVKSVREFIAFAKQRPDQLHYSSAGNGSAPHLTAELFKMRTGVNIVHVPYKGAAPAMTDLLAGHVSLTFATAPSGVPPVQQGKLRALGVSSAGRMPALPDVPTIAEAGVPGYEAVGWNGLVGPAGLPSAVVGNINAEVGRILKAPDIRKRLTDLGVEPRTSSPGELVVFLREEVTKWAKVVKESGARVD